MRDGGQRGERPVEDDLGRLSLPEDGEEATEGAEEKVWVSLGGREKLRDDAVEDIARREVVMKVEWESRADAGRLRSGATAEFSEQIRELLHGCQLRLALLAAAVVALRAGVESGEGEVESEESVVGGGGRLAEKITGHASDGGLPGQSRVRIRGGDSPNRGRRRRGPRPGEWGQSQALRHCSRKLGTKLCRESGSWNQSVMWNPRDQTTS